MGKLIPTLILMGSVIFIFNTFPYMLPAMSKGLYLPYELWILVMLFLYIILPPNVGTYVYRLREENK